MKPVYKRTLTTFLFYAGLFLIGALLNLLSPGGPCVPGLGALFYGFVFPIAAVCSFIWDLSRVVDRGKEYSLALAIDSLILLLLIF